MRLPIFMIALLFGQGAFAGSNGYVVVTYYFDSPVDKDITVTINTGLDYKCMHEHEIKGKTKFTIPAGTVGLFPLNLDNPIYFVSRASIFCGDSCITGSSYFGLSVEASDTRYSWSSSLGIVSGNFYAQTSHLFFHGDDSTNQSICPGKAYCDENIYYYNYTDTPTVYLIYRPSH